MINLREGLEVYRDRPVHLSWKVPAFLNNDWLALRLVQYCEDMGADRPFDMVYGAPHCIWAGGRPSSYTKEMTKDQLEAYFSAYERHGITVALTFSRLGIDKNMVKDPYGNLILSVAEKHNAQAIVADDRLARKIRNDYPHMRLIASYDRTVTTLAARGFSDETQYYKQAFGLYDEVVLRCEYALDDALINELPKELLGKCEVLVNQMCVPNCTVCEKHIRGIEDWAFGSRKDVPCPPCYHLKDVGDPARRLERNVLLSNKRINELAAMGMGRFKIGGRNAPPQKFVDLFVDYIFEPTGAITVLKTGLVGELGMLQRKYPGFMQYNLPDGI
ncbi:MAG: hypothetical protein IKE43_10965 [Coriobacteriales bacterium]|nr:hypothetical protein [Coriobacteriales bacterium]